MTNHMKQLGSLNGSSFIIFFGRDSLDKVMTNGNLVIYVLIYLFVFENR